MTSLCPFTTPSRSGKSAWLFPTFAKHSSAIIETETVGRDKPVAVEFEGIPVVLFRDQAGHIRALVDRRPHRSLELSLGKFCPDDALACAFPGFTFGADGRWSRIPHNPNAKVESVCAQRIAVTERGRLIWLNEITNPSTVSPLRTPDTL